MTYSEAKAHARRRARETGTVWYVLAIGGDFQTCEALVRFEIYPDTRPLFAVDDVGVCEEWDGASYVRSGE